MGQRDDLISSMVLEHTWAVDAASVGVGLRLGWLNAITADLSVAQAVQGTGLLNTGPVPGLLETGPRKNTRFFFILNARL